MMRGIWGVCRGACAVVHRSCTRAAVIVVVVVEVLFVSCVVVVVVVVVDIVRTASVLRSSTSWQYNGFMCVDLPLRKYKLCYLLS